MEKHCSSCFCTFGAEFSVCPHCGYVEGGDAAELFYLKPGTLLAGRYRIGKGIGHGGFGITYLAWDTKFDIQVAVKEYYPGGIVNRVPGTSDVILFAGKRKKQFEFGFTRFVEEARNMAQFSSHRNIVNVYEYFEANHTAYIVMEYLDGIGLDHYLKQKGGKLSPEETVSMALMICSALDAIHQKGIIHRDIAPDNIIVSKDGNIKLIDFGAARFTLDEERKMTVIVKPGFAPPEQYDKVNSQGPWTDVYALGAMLYLIVTGQKPDESTNRVIEDTVTPPHILEPTVPEYLSHAIMKAMALNRVLRFQNVGELEKVLRQEKKVRPLEVERKWRKTKRLVTIGASALVVCFAAVFFGARFLQRVTLPATLVMWYRTTGNATLDMAKQEGLEQNISDFQASYPQVKVELVPVDTAEYEEKLQQAITEGNCPELYESTFLSDELTADAADVSGYLEAELVADCVSEENFTSYCTDEKRVPMAISTIMLFSRSVEQPILSASMADSSMGEVEISFAKKSTAESQTLRFGDSDLWYVESALSRTLDSDDVLPEEFALNSWQDFSNGQQAYMISTSDDYLPLLLSMPGQMQAISLDRGYYFSSVWSVGTDSRNQKKAAGKLLSYMLSEEAQETRFVQHQGCGIPVNAVAMEHFCQVYDDVFGNLSEEIKDGKEIYGG